MSRKLLTLTSSFPLVLAAACNQAPAPTAPAATPPAAAKPAEVAKSGDAAKPAEKPKGTDDSILGKDAAKPNPAAPAASTAAAADGAVDPAIAAQREFIAAQKIDKSMPNWRVKLPQPPKSTFDPAKKYYWMLATTEGPIKVRLMPDVAPMHVSSTIYLTELGFYDTLSFHRVITGFMAQGGCPLGTGTGSPGYKYAGEFSPNVKHDKPGLLSMANAGPNTDGSQFFLTFVPTPHLNGKHTIFGEVVEGMENVKKLESFGSQGGQTKKPLKIESAKIAVE